MSQRLIERFGYGCIGIRIPLDEPDAEPKTIVLKDCTEGELCIIPNSPWVMERNLAPEVCEYLSDEDAQELLESLGKLVVGGRQLNTIKLLLS